MPSSRSSVSDSGERPLAFKPCRRPRGGVPDDREQVAADAAARRLREPERRVRGDRGVDGAAAAAQRRDADLGRERLARRDHAVARHDDGAGGEAVGYGPHGILVASFRRLPPRSGEVQMAQPACHTRLMTTADRNSASVALIGAPTDVGAGRRGASMGPEALRVAGIDKALSPARPRRHRPRQRFRPAQSRESSLRRLPPSARGRGLVPRRARRRLREPHGRRDSAAHGRRPQRRDRLRGGRRALLRRAGTAARDALARRARRLQRRELVAVGQHPRHARQRHGGARAAGARRARGLRADAAGQPHRANRHPLRRRDREEARRRQRHGRLRHAAHRRAQNADRHGGGARARRRARRAPARQLRRRFPRPGRSRPACRRRCRAARRIAKRSSAWR